MVLSENFLSNFDGYNIYERNEILSQFEHLNDPNLRRQYFKYLLGGTGEQLIIFKGFIFDYPKRIFIGENFFANNNLYLNSNANITIGDNAFIGPNVSIITANHPLNSERRNAGELVSDEVKIGNNVWIGANATILPGVSIGNNVVIAAGAVVTKSFEENSILLAGVPAKKVKRV
jgi:Acetyltransferase (isoleucine patch superfamily)